MQPDPKTELTRQWLQTASEDLALADLALRASPPLLSGAVYHCQQAFEKTLKAFLTWQAFPFQPTHDLPILARLCEQVDPAFAALANDAALVTPYATQFRYPPLLVPPTEPDGADALRAARDAFEFALKRLPPATHP